MNKYLFALGRELTLSAAEIEAAFSALSLEPEIEIIDKYLIAELEEDLNTDELMARLGGTIKIAQSISGELGAKKTIIEHLNTNQPTGKIQFSLNDRGLALEIKKFLKGEGRNVRYVEPKNTATVLHNNLVEKKSDYLLTNKEVFVTRAIQPIEEFGERDYGRPKSDDKSGMLPPKLAKIMINLSGFNKKNTLLDPFCGSGTVLMEAAVMGYTQLIGSDLAPKATSDTKENLNWIKAKYKLSFKQTFYNTDSTKLNKKISLNSVDCIVTEPFLGRPLTGRHPLNFLKDQAQELSRLYIKSFASFHTILKPKATVVFVIPSFKIKEEWVEVECIDEIKGLGFEVVSLDEDSDSLRYARPDQHLARNIWKFRKK